MLTVWHLLPRVELDPHLKSAAYSISPLLLTHRIILSRREMLYYAIWQRTLYLVRKYKRVPRSAVSTVQRHVHSWVTHVLSPRFL